MLSLASRRDVQIRIVSQHARSLHRRVLIFLREFLQTVVGFLVHKVALLDPPFDARSGPHPREALFPLQNLEPLAVLHVAHPLVYPRYLAPPRTRPPPTLRYPPL